MGRPRGFTTRQIKAAYIRCGTIKSAAAYLGVSTGTVGYHLKGKKPSFGIAKQPHLSLYNGDPSLDALIREHGQKEQ